MNNLSEELVRLYFIEKGYVVSRNTQSRLSNKLFKDEKGKSDFTITNKKGEKIYVEVKSETTPKLSKPQLDFIKKSTKKGKKVWIVIVSHLGSFLIFEIDYDLKLTLINKGFFKFKKNAFYLNDNGRIVLIDFRYCKQLELEEHLKKLKKSRDWRKKGDLE